MGIDIYMHWKGQTESERKAQFTGFSVESGDVGYLREAYHGEPYATRALVPEAFEDDGADGVPIPVALMVARLPEVLVIAHERGLKIYPKEHPAPAVKAFADFVSLAETKEAETGEPVRVLASY